MPTLDDSILDNLRELNALRERAKQLREQGRKALCGIPERVKVKQLDNDCDLSNAEWVSGPHPIDLALLVRVLNHRDLGDYEYNAPEELTDALAGFIKDHFADDKDLVPTLTAARSMHALVGRPKTVFSTATMLCYYRIVRELYLATFPNWIIGAARAGEDGRVSAFVTGECVRAILAFRDCIADTITFFTTTKKLYLEHTRLTNIPPIDAHLLTAGESHWTDTLNTEFERIALEWYAANNLRRNHIAFDLSDNCEQPASGTSLKVSPVTRPTLAGGNNRKKGAESIASLIPLLFPLNADNRIGSQDISNALQALPSLIKGAIARGRKNFSEAIEAIKAFREAEAAKSKASPNDRRFELATSAHNLALGIIEEGDCEAQRATDAITKYEEDYNLPDLLDTLTKQHRQIYNRIQRVIAPSRGYIQDVLNRELAQAVNSAKFDAGELLFAATCFGALNGWKQNEQIEQARKLLSQIWPEDGRLQTSRPFQSTKRGLRLIPIAFEMTRCFAQLMQKHFTEDLDPKLVRKLLNAFDEHRIPLSCDDNDKIGWNFRGAPEGEKPSVWVTAIAVFALDRTVRMLNERINAIVLRHFNVDWPSSEVEPVVGSASTSGDKLELDDLMYGDYELQSFFRPDEEYREAYKKEPHRVDCVAIAIRLQQMRAHLTRALLPKLYSKSGPPKYKKPYSAIFYGPPGTGKTTLAEALAATAGVPLVRLSPSDLMVQGADVIESRARAIFDSLSMLTQAVIFLDEFEPVLRTRRQPQQGFSDQPQQAAAPDPPEFKFLVTGMLPKLIKLNKAAEKQSVVYCLATNYLDQLDDAAKRIGRFDLQIPIYHPDPMSRAGVFLYRLIKILQKEQQRKQEHRNNDEQVTNWQDELTKLVADPIFWQRVQETIQKTREVSAQSLATVFFSTNESDATTKTFFNYVRRVAEEPPEPTEEESDAADTTVEKDIVSQRNKFEDSWRRRSATKASTPPVTVR